MGKVARAVVSPLSIIDKDLGRLALQVVGTVAAFIPGGQIVSALALTASATLFKPKRKAGGGDSGFRSRVNIDPTGPDVLPIGQTAGITRLIHFDTEGADNDTLSMIYEHASGPISSYGSLYINNELTTIDGSGNVTSGPYAGFLTIQTAAGSQSANPFTSVAGGRWGASHIGQGRALSHFRWTYNAEALASGLPQNIQWVLNSTAVYDPRRDSTRGGTGTMRADDQSTWAYSVSGTDIGRNPALVELTYRLGWKKNGRLWAGMGEDPDNIDYDSYIAAANVCDEVVNSKSRYRIDGMLSLADDHNTNLGKIHATCAGRMVDQGGLIAFWVANDDIADVVMTLTDDDFKADLQWQPLPDGERRNTGRGSFVDPAAFYVSQPYEEVVATTPKAQDNNVELADDGMSYELVQDRDQARRLTSIRIHESRQGRLQAVIDLRGIKLRPTDVVAITHARWNWTAKTFRVESWSLTADFKVALTLSAIASADYADLANVATSSPASLDTAGYVPTLGTLAGLNAVDLADGAQVLNRSADNIAEAATRKWASESGATRNALGQLLKDSTYDSPPWTLTTGATRRAGSFVSSTWPTSHALEVSSGESSQVYAVHQIPATGERTIFARALFANGATSQSVVFGLYAFDAAGVELDREEVTVTAAEIASGSRDFRELSLDLPTGTARVDVQIDNRTLSAGGGVWYVGNPVVSYSQTGGDKTILQPVVGLLSPTTGRAISRRLLGQFSGSGVDRLISTNPLSASTDLGGDASITINAHDEYDDAGTLSFTSSSISGLTASTLYHVYEDNADYTAGARSYVATTTRSNLAAAGRRYVASITTPASGGSSSGTGGTGGGWSGDGDIP